VRAVVAFALAASPASVFCGDRQIAFERDQAVWIANLDGTGEKKIADGIFPAISPDGTRIAFNTTEKTSDTTYARHIAVVDIGTGKIDVLKISRAIIRTTRAGRLTGNKSFSQRVLTRSGIWPW
jgi:hypothetical protein